MISWLKTLNGKDLTTAGATIVAILLIITLYKVLTNDLLNIEKAVNNQTETTKETNVVLRELTGVIHTNTETLRILENRIR